MKIFTDYDVRHRDTEDITKALTDPARLLSDGSATTPSCLYRVYEFGRDTTLKTFAASGAGSVELVAIAGYEIGGGIEIYLDDGTQQRDLIADIVGDVVTLTGTLNADASTGRMVRKVLGDDVTSYETAMAGYGTPAVASLDWGWTAILPGDFKGLRGGQSIRIEIDFEGDIAGGLDDYAIICEDIEARC